MFASMIVHKSDDVTHGVGTVYNLHFTLGYSPLKCKDDYVDAA